MSVESPWHSARCNQQVIHYDQTSVANGFRTTRSSFSGRFGFVLLALKCCNDTHVFEVWKGCVAFRVGGVAVARCALQPPDHSLRTVISSQGSNQGRVAFYESFAQKVRCKMEPKSNRNCGDCPHAEARYGRKSRMQNKQCRTDVLK